MGASFTSLVSLASALEGRSRKVSSFSSFTYILLYYMNKNDLADLWKKFQGQSSHFKTRPRFTPHVCKVQALLFLPLLYLNGSCFQRSTCKKADISETFSKIVLEAQSKVPYFMSKQKNTPQGFSVTTFHLLKPYTSTTQILTFLFQQ